MTPKPRQRSRGSSRSRAPIVIGVVVVVALGLVAVLATRDGSDDATVDTASGNAESRPVSVSGQVLPTLEGGKADAAVGQAAPSITGASFDGTAVSVGGGVGSPQLVFVVAHWCPHCQKEVPVIARWLRDKGAPAGVELRGVSTGVNEDAPNYPPSAWLTSEGWTIPTLADDANGSAARALGLSAYPFFVAIDGGGRVVARTSGELTIQAIEGLVQAARAAS